jgi:PTS system galactitol-specific IIC component
MLLGAIMMVVGLAVRMGFTKSLTAGLKIAVGFVMIQQMVRLITQNMFPAMQAVVERTGLDLEILDVGAHAVGVAALGTDIGLFIIPLGFALNIILLLIGVTKTLNTDLGALWQTAFGGTVVALMTNSPLLGWVTAIALITIMLMGADRQQKKLSELGEMPGASFSNCTAVGQYFFASVLNKVYDKVLPFLKDKRIETSDLEERVGIYGKPIVVGLVVGVLIAILAGYDFFGVLGLGAIIAAILYSYPFFSKTLQDGLRMVAAGGRDYFEERFGGRQIFVGVNWFALLKPEALEIGLLLMPITLLLAAILPGMRVLPLTDLAYLFSAVTIVVVYTKGDLLRSFIMGIIAVILSLYLAQWYAPYATEIVAEFGQGLPEGSTKVSALWVGWEYLVSAPALLVQLVKALVGLF